LPVIDKPLIFFPYVSFAGISFVFHVLDSVFNCDIFILVRSIGEIDMPIYEYRCEKCGHEFEKRVTFAQAAILPDCPVCKSGETAKKISMFCAPGVAGGSGSSSCAGCQGGSCSSCGH